MILPKIRILIFLIVLVFTSFKSQAQRDIDFNYELWWGVMTSTQISNNFAIWNDLHFVNDLFLIYRTGLTYHSKKDYFVTTAGYGVLRLTAPFSEGRLVRTEHRPWMQTIFRIPSQQKLSTSFRFRYDARFIRNLSPEELAPGYSFNHRWRFNNSLRYRWGNVVSPNTVLTSVFLNESLITSGPGPNGFPFEHRTHLLASLNKGIFTYTFGYLVRFMDVNPSTFRINQGLVFWVSINFNLMKGDKQTFIEFPIDHAD